MKIALQQNIFFTVISNGGTVVVRWVLMLQLISLDAEHTQCGNAKTWYRDC